MFVERLKSPPLLDDGEMFEVLSRCPLNVLEIHDGAMKYG